jgi:hypothetical protein
MIAGHFGVDLVAKSRAPSVPVWAFALATQWLEVIFVPLYAAGIETLSPLSGTRSGYGEATILAAPEPKSGWHVSTGSERAMRHVRPGFATVGVISVRVETIRGRLAPSRPSDVAPALGAT